MADLPITDPLKGLSKGQKTAAVIGSIGVGGYVLYKHHSSTGSWNPWSSGTAASSAGTANAIDPTTGLPTSQDNAIDPITNLPYLQEAETYGSVQAAEASVSAFGLSSATGSGVGVVPASGGTNQASANTVVGGNVYTSNAAWSTAVQTGLTDIGYDPIAIATALGLYLTGQPMSASQAQLVNAGIAEFGPAPIGNLQIILQPPSTPATPVTTPSSGGTGKPVTIPHTPTGVTGTAISSSEVSLKWLPVSGATSYNIRVTYQGNLVNSGIATTPYRIVNGLQANRTYTFHVAAVNSAGMSAETNGPAVRTKP